MLVSTRLLPALAGLLVGLLLASAPAEVRAQYFAFGKNKVQYRSHAWRYLETSHFDVYYYEDSEPLAQYAARSAEVALAQVEQLVGHSLGQRVSVLVYRGHNDFAVTNAVDLPIYAEGIAGVTELFKNRVVVPFTGDYRTFRRVLHHEIVHALLNDVFYGGSVQSALRNNVRLQIPLWFGEGLAEYAAQGWGTKPDMYVREAVLHGGLPRLDRLRGYMVYPGGQSFWDYVATQYGRPAVAEILTGLEETRSVEESIERALGLSLPALSEQWQNALREAHYPEVTARQRIEEVGRLLTQRHAGRVQLSPALDPQGARVAYIAATGAFFDVYVAPTQDDGEPVKLVDGQQSAAFESLRLQEPGLSWRPDGEKLAVAVKAGASDAVAVIDLATQEVTHYRVPGVDQVAAVAWSPDGGRIAFSGTHAGQSDLYVLDLETGEAVNHTDDVFSDHEPSWSPSGEALVFHSDRGTHTATGRYRSPASDAVLGRRSFDLYRLPLGGDRAERLTTGAWDDRSPRFAADPGRLLFLSDRNGILNLYEKNLQTGEERPVTDVAVGLTQFSLSSDGKRAVVVSLREGRPSLYLVSAPFAQRPAVGALRPSVWAQRADPAGDVQAPAVELAAVGRRLRNPFLRDATDGRAYAAEWEVLPTLVATRDPFAEPDTAAARPTPDSTAYGTVRIDFGGGGERVDDSTQAASADSTAVTAAYEERRYKLLFSPDLIYGAAGYDALYGVQGVAQMLFSDMMGNHRLLVSTNLLLDLRNADYAVSYSYLPRRTDWGLSLYHTARLLPSYEQRTYYRYRRYGLSLRASYPVDKFRRVDVDAGVVGVSRADIGNPRRPSDAHALFSPSLTFTHDDTAPGAFGPRGGRRLGLGLSGGVGPIRFATALADGRAYVSFGDAPYTLAVRGAAGLSVGPTPQLFFAAGVQNWLNRNFDPANGFPVDEVTDFAFATPVLPLRGHAFNARGGTSFGLANVAFRFPLHTVLSQRFTGWLPFYNLQGAVFADAATIQGGPGSDDRFIILGRDADGHRTFEDLMVGTGAGVRTYVMGYPVRFDVAWPFDGHRFGRSQLYISIGFDF